MISAVLSCTTLLACAQPAPSLPRPVPFTQVTFTDEFWAPRQQRNAQATLDQNFVQCRATGRIGNLQRAGAGETGGFKGLFFDDSDVFKALEGAANVYAINKSPELKAMMDELIATIARAQRPDGYVNSYFTLEKPAERWVNLKDMHELYCAGHLIEAGVAHHQATGERTLLDVAIRLADHIDATFGPGKRAGVCGHPEIELALVRLARHTGEEKYRALARYFVLARGVPDGRALYGEYAQDHAPLTEQESVVGHAVRAMYLYSAAADLATDDAGLRGTLTPTLDRLWDNLTLRKMYVTGGIGNSASNEGFTRDFDLPNDRAYAETCAGIGLVMWAHRMCVLNDDARYADIMEQALYNAVLSGISLDGRQFFYVNPMMSNGEHQRRDWYPCACCPPNILRLIASLGGYVATADDEGVRINLFADCTINTTIRGTPVTIDLDTRYPWDGRITAKVRAGAPIEFALRLRSPAWCQVAGIEASFGAPNSANTRGYLEVRRRWADGDSVTLDLAMPITSMVASPRLPDNKGMVALRRGPIVYCFEGADQPASLRAFSIDDHAPATSAWRADLLGGVQVLSVPAQRVAAPDFTDRLYDDLRASEPASLTAVPYFAWANRGKGEMRVWMPQSPALAASDMARAGPRASASHCWHADSPDAIIDDLTPASSSDHTAPRLTWWPRKGSVEWAQLTFAVPREISSAGVMWFDDSGKGGGCSLPVEWNLEYLIDGEWKPVAIAPGAAFGVAPDVVNSVRFAPVTTTALRVNARLAPDRSAGVLEFRTDARRPNR